MEAGSFFPHGRRPGVWSNSSSSGAWSNSSSSEVWSNSSSSGAWSNFSSSGAWSNSSSSEVWSNSSSSGAWSNFSSSGAWSNFSSGAWSNSSSSGAWSNSSFSGVWSNSSSSGAWSNSSSSAASCRMMAERVFLPFSVLNVLTLVPVCCWVLVLGLRRVKRGVTHADFLTLQMVVVELVGVCGTLLFALGLTFRLRYVRLWGFFLVSLVFALQTLFHCLACVERYVAVVHAVTYRSLPRPRAVRMRNAAAAVVWLAGLAWALVVSVTREFHMQVYFVLLSLSLTLVLYCSLAVLKVLTRRGPKDKDQTKRRAFNLILLILLVLLLRFGGFVASYGFIRSAEGRSAACVVLNLAVFLLLPGSFLLPSLFLQREVRRGGRKGSREEEMKSRA